MTIRALISDVDGTLIDSNDQHALAWLKTFRRYGFDVAFEAIRGQIGKGGDQLMPVFLPPDFIQSRGEEVEQFRKDLFKREFLPGLQPFPSVWALFERARSEGVKLVLATSASGDELERYKEIAGIADLLQGATSADDAAHSKPDPDIFLAALKTAGVQADEAMVIGDTPYDAQAAGKAGLRAVGVLCGGFSEETLREAGCVAVYRDPAHLLAAYDQSLLAAPA